MRFLSMLLILSAVICNTALPAPPAAAPQTLLLKGACFHPEDFTPEEARIAALLDAVGHVTNYYGPKTEKEEKDGTRITHRWANDHLLFEQETLIGHDFSLKSTRINVYYKGQLRFTLANGTLQAMRPLIYLKSILKYAAMAVKDFEETKEMVVAHVLLIGGQL